ncbi:cyclin-dependent kinase F-1 [Phalaenopsis equestris]|uniref:cyclin-dependent kinase F-1 n=1 Tax=Phalaenopsis equestris TaxID=78828 RepID=UPI0009E40910|nr:cyclin-dependent kinase F-1 [Phalaenopsis equestris]
MDAPPFQSSRSWSIYGRSEITEHYEILERIGSGAYSDVYRGRRLSDGLFVALKEIHDYQSAFREIEALQILRHAPNVVELIEYFWQEDEDAVLVLEFLHADLAAVIRDGKKAGVLPAREVKQWMLQILRGVDACHRNLVVHRDLKPSNLLISADGVLKLADFGQARIIQGTGFMNEDSFVLTEEVSQGKEWIPQDVEVIVDMRNHSPDPLEIQILSSKETIRPLNEHEYLVEVEDIKAKYSDETDMDTSLHDGDVSCLATCSTDDIEDAPFKSSYSYEVAEGRADDESGTMTSCVGTRWFRAPELLYGSTNYGQEVDLWSLGCIFSELLSLEPLFPGSSDIDQIGRIISVLGDFNEETSPGCSKLPDYNKIAFNKVDNPIGLEGCLQNRSSAEVAFVRKLVRYDPATRATAAELLADVYFKEEPLPAPLNELKVPSSRDGQDEKSSGEWGDYRDMGSDSDFDDFGGVTVASTGKGFSIRFS